MAIKKNHL